jgi:hypothetical protein
MGSVSGFQSQSTVSGEGGDTITQHRAPPLGCSRPSGTFLHTSRPSTGLTEHPIPSGLYGVSGPSSTIALPASARLKLYRGVVFVIKTSTLSAKPGTRCTPKIATLAEITIICKTNLFRDL